MVLIIILFTPKTKSPLQCYSQFAYHGLLTWDKEDPQHFHANSQDSNNNYIPNSKDKDIITSNSRHTINQDKDTINTINSKGILTKGHNTKANMPNLMIITNNK